MTVTTVDVCVIGAGAAGLSVAAGAAQLGLKTTLVERGEMGGECLNSGCVPSKALLAAAKRAHAIRQPNFRGVGGQEPHVDFGKVKESVSDVISAIAPNDSVERFEGLGVHVIKGVAKLQSANLIQVGPDTIHARWIVLATGSRASIPPIPGLQRERILTNETIFTVRERPSHLVIVGGGPIGVEMAVAHRRLGAPVTLLERARVLPLDEPELVDALRASLREEGIDIFEDASIDALHHGENSTRIAFTAGDSSRTISASHVLVAAGREPVVEGLGLEAAGIKFGPRGIVVDSRLRAGPANIFAVGDVADAPHFTHVAAYHAGIVIRNIAFRMPASVNYDALPWVTYSDPELAHVGLTEADARRRLGESVRSHTLPFKRNDRAVAEFSTSGVIKVVTGKRGRLLGVSILAPGAGEMIAMWCLAIRRGLTMRAIAELMLPYPTFGEIGKAVAGEYYRDTLFSAKVKRIVRALQWLPNW